MTKQEHLQAAAEALDAMMSAKATEETERAAADYAFHMSRANA